MPQTMDPTELNDLRRKIVNGREDEVSRDDLRAAIATLRSQRQKSRSQFNGKKASKKKASGKMSKDQADDLLGDLL